MPGRFGSATTGKPKVDGRRVRPDLAPLPAEVVRAVDAPVVLEEQGVGLRRVAVDLVHALAELRGGLGQERRLDAGVGRLPRGPVEGAVEAGGRHGDGHPGAARRDRGGSCGGRGRRRPAPTAAGARGPTAPRRAGTTRRRPRCGTARPAPPRRRRPAARASPAGWSCHTRATAAPARSGNLRVSGSGSTQVAPRSSDRYTDGPQCELVAPTSSRLRPPRQSSDGGVDLLTAEPRAGQLPRGPCRVCAEREEALGGAEEDDHVSRAGVDPRASRPRTRC